MRSILFLNHNALHTARISVIINDMTSSTPPSPLSVRDVTRIAKLASIPVTETQTEALTKQLGVTVSYVSKLQELSTDGVIETSQVTGLENVFREDVVDEKHMLTQDQALSGAKHVHNGYFVVPAVFEN